MFVKDYCTQNYICQENGEPLTRRKKAVLDRIMQMGLPGGEDGETVLCSHDIASRPPQHPGIGHCGWVRGRSR